MSKTQLKVHPLLKEGLFPILDKSFAPELPMAQIIESFLDADANFFLIRQKNLSDDELKQDLSEIAELRNLMDFDFVIHHNLDFAKHFDASGIHLTAKSVSIAQARKELGADKLIGYSAHSYQEAKSAQDQGADYVFLGSIFPTQKDHPYKLLGLDELGKTCQDLLIPVYAIGGITDETLPQIKQAGAFGFAALRAVYQNAEIEHNISKLGFIWEEES